MGDAELLTIQCPNCGEGIEVIVDLSQLPAELIEDCSVCCRPMNLKVEMDGGIPLVSVSTDAD